MTVETKAYTVYRLYDAEHNPLYVGATANLEQRIAHHRSQREWWPEVASVETETFPSLGTAIDAELARIKTLTPRYNRRHNSAYAGPPPKTSRGVRVSSGRLKMLRVLKNMTQRKLSAESGVSQNTIVYMEKQGRVEGFRPATLHKLATALGVEPAELLAD